MSLQTRIEALATAVATAVKNKQDRTNASAALASVTPAGDRFAYFTSATAAALAVLTPTARTLLSQGTTAAMRTLLDVYSKAESAALQPGMEMGYSERTSNFTSTNVTYGSTAAANIVTGLSVTVVGEGRPVDLEFNTVMQHTVANARVNAYFLSNGGTTAPGGGHLHVVQTVNPNVGVSLVMRKRTPPLVNGTSYTFTVGIYGSTAGTVQVTASSAIPAYLSVTRR